VSWEAALAAVCLPVIFIHVRWQPGVAVGFGQTTLNAYLSDFAVVAIVAAAIASGVRHGFGPLRGARWIWGTGAAFLLWIFFELAYPAVHTAAYSWHVHAATAAKFAEYALLAPALPLVLRGARDLVALLWSFTLWSVVATGVGIAQFFGAAIFISGRIGGRQGSFLSDADFAALSGAVLVVGLIASLLPESAVGRRLGVLALTSGLLGLILAASVASLLGFATAALVLTAVILRRGTLTRQRMLTAAAVVVVAGAGVITLRGGDLGSFARFLGASSNGAQAHERTVQTYAHRTLLAWIGYQIWKDHPVIGAGWEASGDPATFERYLPAAHRHFPSEPAAAFPSRDHSYGVQNVWIQSLADLGVIGLALLLAMFVAVAVTGWRVARSTREAAGVIGLGWTALVVWLWTAQGFIAGIPLDAVTWLGFGLVATGAARSRAGA
jgi:O-antigen ligase